MSAEKLTERQWISAHCSGIGARRAHGKGSVGAQRVKDGTSELIEVSIGRSTYHGYSNHTAATAWVQLTPAKAHELACLLSHLTHADFPCQGAGVQNKGSHDYKLKVDVEFTVDLCTMLSKKKDLLKKEILEAVEKQLDSMQLPSKEDEDNVPSK